MKSARTRRAQSILPQAADAVNECCSQQGAVQAGKDLAQYAQDVPFLLELHTYRQPQQKHSRGADCQRIQRQQSPLYPSFHN